LRRFAPRFRSGDYLVTLEYATPVKFGKMFIRHIDAFLSELDTIEAAERSALTWRTPSGSTALQAA